MPPLDEGMAAAIRRTLGQDGWQRAYSARMRYTQLYGDAETVEQWMDLCPICNEGTVQHLDSHPTCPVCVPTPATTGPTQRLARVCLVCGDEPPAGAVFCIACGMAV